MKTINIGDRVRFALADDIEAIVTGKAESAAAGREVEVAWINKGDRMTAWVSEYEIAGTQGGGLV